MYIERVAGILPVHTGCKDPFEIKKKKIKLSKETFSAEKERLMNYYDILTPFLWCSPHKCPTVGVPDKMAKVLTSLPTSPLLLQGGHDEVLC